MLELRDPKFHARSTAIITLANEQAKTASISLVSESMISATSRYNAFVSASTVTSASELEAKRAEATETYINQCRKMFQEQFTDYVQNFDTYRVPMTTTPRLF